MTKVCVIGDSHIGALRRAAAGRELEFDVTYFTGHVEMMVAVSIEGRELVAPDETARRHWQRTSGGQASIRVDDYDCFIITGLGLGLAPSHARMGMERLLDDLYGNYVCDGMAQPADGKYLVSEDCFVAAAEGLLQQREALRIAGMIRSLCNTPILVVPVPNPSAGFDEEEFPARFASLFGAARNGDGDALAAVFASACQRLSKRNGVRIMPHPGEAAEAGLFNRREFCALPASTEGLPRAAKVKALTHGNARFGAILWSNIEAAMAELAVHPAG